MKKKELLHKYLTNNFTEEELIEAINWLKTEGLSEEGKKLGLDEWENYTAEDDVENDERFTVLFDKIQMRINEKDAEKLIHQKPEGYSLRKLSILLTKAAAILLIPVLAIWVFTLSQKNAELASYTNLTTDTIEVIAPIGSRTVVQLTDGSVAHLNYGSKLKYPHIFSTDTRDVILIGEGYFEVAHNPEVPFVVHAGNLNVKAVGTEFNVLAYPDDEVFETTLVNGKVILEKINSDNEVTTIGAMKPTQHVQYNMKSNEISSAYVKVDKYTAWKDGKLMFVDTPIKDVAEKLSRMFNVDIEVDKAVADYNYTVTFVGEPLSQILDLMSIATPVTYKMLPRKKLPNGCFSKQKIIISKKI